MRVSIIALSVLASTGLAQAEQVVYPAKGQPAELQQADQAACHTWAVEQSGYDPASPPAPPTTPAQPAQKSTGPTGARARGALGGALIGEIADGDAGEAALVGAALGGSRERRQKRAESQQSAAKAGQEQAAATEKRKQGEEAYLKARAACLEGRGYVVK